MAIPKYLPEQLKKKIKWAIPTSEKHKKKVVIVTTFKNHMSSKIQILYRLNSKTDFRQGKRTLKERVSYAKRIPAI